MQSKKGLEIEIKIKLTCRFLVNRRTAIHLNLCVKGIESCDFN